MKADRWFKEQSKQLEGDFEYRLEGYILDLTRQICTVMEAKKISRAELARKMNVSKAYITELLTGTPNLTLESMLKLSEALGGKLTVEISDPAVMQDAVKNYVQRWNWEIPGESPSSMVGRKATHKGSVSTAEPRQELAEAA